jgi:hypothetical protein
MPYEEYFFLSQSMNSSEKKEETWHWRRNQHIYCEVNKLNWFVHNYVRRLEGEWKVKV